jgi:hypothetical protein
VKKDEAAFLEMMLKSISAQVTTEIKAPAMISMANAKSSAERSDYGLLVQRTEEVQRWITYLLLELKTAVEKSIEVEKISRAELSKWDDHLASLERKLESCRYLAQRLGNQKILEGVEKVVNRVRGLRQHIKTWW